MHALCLSLNLMCFTNENCTYTFRTNKPHPHPNPPLEREGVRAVHRLKVATLISVSSVIFIQFSKIPACGASNEFSSRIRFSNCPWLRLHSNHSPVGEGLYVLPINNRRRELFNLRHKAFRFNRLIHIPIESGGE